MANSDFVTKFYNIEGDTISERKKCLGKLLNAQRVSLTEEDLKDLQPRTYLEKQFLIDVFIYFNLSAKLLDVIKEGNVEFTCRILKHPRILKEATAGISPEKIVNDFLPSTSYLVRMKILKKISFFLEESQMDEIIFWVHKRYGLNIALRLLVRGSASKIKEYLFKYELTLKPRQIQLIFNKNPDLLVVYLNHYKKLTGKIFKHNKLSKYIAKKNPDFWLKLHREEVITSVVVGRRTSKYIIDRNTKDFLENTEYYKKFIRLDIIDRTIYGNYKLYINFFPRNINQLNMDDFCSKLLRYQPKQKRWNLFEQAFMEVFQRDILDNLIYLNSDFLKMFPDQAIKNMWAEVHYENDTSKSELLTYCHPNKAIPLIKEKISVTSNPRKREELIQLLVKNCGQNQDSASLEDVLQYVWVHHRNKDVFLSILDEVAGWFDLEQLNESHWNHIREIVTFIRFDYRLKCRMSTLFLKHIEFLFLHGKPYRNEILTFLKDSNSHRILIDIEVHNLKLKEQLFVEMIGIYLDRNDLRDDFKIVSLIYDIFYFNEKHPEHYIDLSPFPSIVARIESIYSKEYDEMHWQEMNILHKVTTSNLKHPENPIVKMDESQILKVILKTNSQFNFDECIRIMVTKHSRSKFENDILEIFWDRFEINVYLRKTVVRWFFNNEPKIIVPYIEKIFKIDKRCLNLARVRLMSHLNLDKKLIDYCTEQLENYLLQPLDTSSASCDSNDSEEDTPTLDSGIIKTLSALLPTNEYIEMIEKHFVPINGGIENADEMLNKMNHCEIAKYFKDTQEPIKTLPTLMKFCLGNYQHSALPSLYSVCCRTPETLLYSYIDLLSKGSIRVKKHALYLSLEFLNFQATVKMIQKSDEPAST